MSEQRQQMNQNEFNTDQSTGNLSEQGSKLLSSERGSSKKGHLHTHPGVDPLMFKSSSSMPSGSSSELRSFQSSDLGTGSSIGSTSVPLLSSTMGSSSYGTGLGSGSSMSSTTAPISSSSMESGSKLSSESSYGTGLGTYGTESSMHSTQGIQAGSVLSESNLLPKTNQMTSELSGSRMAGSSPSSSMKSGSKLSSESSYGTGVGTYGTGSSSSSSLGSGSTMESGSLGSSKQIQEPLYKQTDKGIGVVPPVGSYMSPGSHLGTAAPSSLSSSSMESGSKLGSESSYGTGLGTYGTGSSSSSSLGSGSTMESGSLDSSKQISEPTYRQTDKGIGVAPSSTIGSTSHLGALSSLSSGSNYGSSTSGPTTSGSTMSSSTTAPISSSSMESGSKLGSSTYGTGSSHIGSGSTMGSSTTAPISSASTSDPNRWKFGTGTSSLSSGSAPMSSSQTTVPSSGTTIGAGGGRIPIPAGTVSTAPAPGFHTELNSQFPVESTYLHRQSTVGEGESAFPGKNVGEKVKSATGQFGGWIKEEVQEISHGLKQLVSNKGTGASSTTTPSSHPSTANEKISSSTNTNIH